MKNAKPIADWKLERYLLGELPTEETERIRRQLQEDETASLRLSHIEKSNEEILAQYPPEIISRRIKERLQGTESQSKSEGRARAFRLAFYVLPAAAAIVLLITLSPLNQLFQGPERGLQTVRLKGSANPLIVYRKTQIGSEQLKEGDLAQKNDTLQLSYRAGEAEYGAIFSVDGRGLITWHLPNVANSPPKQAPALEKSGEILLSFSYVLDDAPSFERFFFVTSSEPFTLAAVVRAAEKLASSDSPQNNDLPVNRNLDQYSLLLKKNAPEKEGRG
jgi:hypothetical protein